jgi:predicted acyltransferase
MIIVNNPGSRENVFICLKHVFWNGLHIPSDIVFPFFTFVMGLSLFCSLQKLSFVFSPTSFHKIFFRFMFIFLIGLFLNFINNFSFENLRIFGVLQRLSLTYGFSSIIILTCGNNYLSIVMIVLLLGYQIFLKLFGCYELSENNIISVVDCFLVGKNHMYKITTPDGVIFFDPEGFISTIGSICHALYGFFVIANISVKPEDLIKSLKRQFLNGIVFMIIGILVSYYCPMNKKLWSPSYVLFTGGIACCVIVFLIWVTDERIIKKTVIFDNIVFKNLLIFFEIFGCNSLFIYLVSTVLSKILKVLGVQTYVYTVILAPIVGKKVGSLIWPLLLVVVTFMPVYLLYKKHVYIKI